MSHRIYNPEEVKVFIDGAECIPCPAYFETGHLEPGGWPASDALPREGDDHEE